MFEDLTKSEYMMKLPIPVFIAEKNTERIFFANAAAEEAGLIAGDIVNEISEGICSIPGAAQKSVSIKTKSSVLHAEICETQIYYNEKEARMITLLSVSSEKAPLSEWDICAAFITAHRNGVKNEFLQLTAKDVGAFSAALYESRGQRYILRDEWRSRRSASIPVLRSDFLLQVSAESEKIKQIKCAADIAVIPYIKSHGTKGVAVYFFDSELSEEKRKQLSGYIELYGLFSYDVPDTFRHALHHGVNAMEQGIVVWNGQTRSILYCNTAYRDMFGRNNIRMISNTLGKDIHGRVSKEVITDGQGRYFDVTHTVCGSRGRGIISTIIIDNTAYVKAQRKLDAMARTDALTGLFNRRAGLEYLSKIYAECRAQKKPLTVCFADIDGLKHINDTWGHGAGDALIQSAANVIKKHVADPGTVCRLGGDEFVLIMPGMSLQQSSLVASQISREAAQCYVGNGDGITISFGFVQAQFTAGETVESLVSLADTEMYREKNRKVNR